MSDESHSNGNGNGNGNGRGGGVQKFTQAVNSPVATFVYRAATMAFMTILTAVGLPVIMNAGNLLIELSRKVDRVPLQIDLVKGDISLLKSDISGRQTSADFRLNQQGDSLNEINKRLADMARDLGALQRDQAVMQSRLDSLYDLNKNLPRKP